MAYGEMGRAVKKRALVVGGRNTSVSLEDAFWKGVRDIANERGLTMAGMVELINARREQNNLSSAVRLFVLGFYRERVAEQRQRGERSPSGAEATGRGRQDVGPPASR
jgi:predicted DNA-binding ribbon-helix-helix protein